MKIRTDFVTNSSSSSFIIGKKEDEHVTVEYVYDLLRKMYLELQNNLDSLISYLEKKNKLGIKPVKENNKLHFEFTSGNRYDAKSRNIANQLERDFGVNVLLYYEDLSWTDCYTYEEYEKYWLEKMKNNKDWTVHAPFTIVDFLAPKEVNWLHFKGKELHTVDYTNDTFLWYFPYFEEALSNPDSCEYCDEKYCDKKKCHNTKTLLKEQNIDLENICLNMLGRVCICSECGYINESIVKKLYKISEYAEDHMG